MPPKKKEEEKPTPLMGRFGTSLKCGIVGLPNVGLVHVSLPFRYLERDNCLFIFMDSDVFPRGIFRKSTFFNVLTKSAAAAENFPFCTIG